MNLYYINSHDPCFPYQLKNIQDRPKQLAIIGSLYPKDHKAIAIVGTRQPAPESIKIAYQLAHQLAEQGYTIVSGLARGIDTAAHWGALHANGRTIAVLGSGHDHIYPSENIELAQAIAKQGALVSEFQPHEAPKHYHFPKRNRIITGLSMAVVLIEAPVKSGAMIAMDFGAKQGRLLFAHHTNTFQGNHHLITQRKAIPFTNAQQILDVLAESNPQPEQLTFNWSDLRIGAYSS